MFRSRDSRYSQKLRKILWPKKGFQRSFFYLRERISRMSASTHALSLGIACGAAASMTPFIGLHFFIAAVIAYLIRGNLFASAIGTVVGNPWTFPLIWAADNYVGGLVVSQFGLEERLAYISAGVGPDMPMAFFFKITLGGVILAIVTFPLYYGLCYWGLSSWRVHRERKKLAKTEARRARQEPVAPDLQTASQPDEPSAVVKNPEEAYDQNSKIS